MKQQLLEWWKGTFETFGFIDNTGELYSSPYIITRYKYGREFTVYKLDSEDLKRDVVGRYTTLNQAYEASLIHFLKQNKGLLEIVYEEGMTATDKFDKRHEFDFESWFKEVTE